MQNIIKKIILSLIGTTIILIAGYFIYQNIFFVNTDDAQIEGHTVMIAPKINGFITKVNAIQGQKVKKGDVLVEIDQREFKNILKESKASLISLTARLKDAELNYRRTEKLYKQGAATLQQYDTNLTNYTDIKAQFESASAQVSQAELNLEWTHIQAPFNGTVAKTAAEIGQFASVGSPLIGFVDSDERWVTANFKESEIEDIKSGQNAIIEVDAFPKKSFTGKVFALSSATGASFTLLPPDNASGNFTKIVQRVPVRIALNNLTADDIELLKSGLSVFVKIKKKQ